MSVAIHVLLWMGAKNIYFVGCDLDNSKSDYYHGQKLEDKNKEWNTSLYNDLYIWMKWFTRTSKNYNIELKSCSENSRLNNMMEYVHIEDAINKSQLNIAGGGTDSFFRFSVMKFLFDIDGTLTPPRKAMESGEAMRFLSWMSDKNVYIVSGSDRKKRCNNCR